jgi:hypothetical protein
MESKDTRRMVIHFTNGRKRNFVYETANVDSAVLSGRVEKLLNARHLILETDDKMIVLPYDNIESIEISPKPDKVPLVAIKVLRED